MIINSNLGGGTDFSEATITTDKVFNGYKGYDANGELITGTALSTTTTAAAGKILNGYTAYDNSGNLITGTALSTASTANAATIKNGYTAYDNSGNLITGTNTDIINPQGSTVSYNVAAGSTIAKGDFVEIVPVTLGSSTLTDLPAYIYTSNFGVRTCKLDNNYISVATSSDSGNGYMQVVNLSTGEVVYNFRYGESEFTSPTTYVSDNRIFLGWLTPYNGSGVYLNYYYITTSSNSIIKAWSSTRSQYASYSGYFCQASRLSDDTFVIAFEKWRQGWSAKEYDGWFYHMRINGNTLTTLGSNTFSSNSSLTYSRKWYDIGGYLVAYRGSTWYLFTSSMSQYATGSTTPTIKQDDEPIENCKWIPRTSNTRLVIGIDYSDNNYLSAAIVTQSGSALSWGSAVRLTGTSSKPLQIAYRQLSDNTYAVYCINTAKVLTVRTVTVSGSTITYQNEETLHDFSSVTDASLISMCGDYIDQGYLFVTYYLDGNYYIWKKQIVDKIKKTSEAIDGIAVTAGSAGETISVCVPSPLPTYIRGTAIEESTEALMNEQISSINEGKYYKYTGTTGTYTQDTTYQVIANGSTYEMHEIELV